MKKLTINPKDFPSLCPFANDGMDVISTLKWGDDFCVLSKYPRNPRVHFYMWSGSIWYKSGFSVETLSEIVVELTKGKGKGE